MPVTSVRRAEGLAVSDVRLPSESVDALLSHLDDPRLSWARPPLMLALARQGAPPQALAAATLPYALHGAPGIDAQAPRWEETREGGCVALWDEASERLSARRAATPGSFQERCRAGCGSRG